MLQKQLGEVNLSFKDSVVENISVVIDINLAHLGLFRWDYSDVEFSTASVQKLTNSGDKLPKISLNLFDPSSSSSSEIAFCKRWTFTLSGSTLIECVQN